MTTIKLIVIALFLGIGTTIMLLAAFGLIRFGDVFLRAHAATKASTLGIGFIMAGVAVYFADPLVTFKLIALTAIYFLTSPIGAQVLTYGAHCAGVPKVKETWIDELSSDEEKAGK